MICLNSGTSAAESAPPSTRQADPHGRSDVPGVESLDRGDAHEPWRLTDVPWPVLLFVATLLLPAEASFELGSLRLTGQRLVLLVATAVGLPMLLMGLAGRVRVFDWLIMGHAGWVMLALSVTESPAQGLESGGIYVAEAVGAYLLARMYLRDERAFRGLCGVLWVVVAVLLPLALIEGVTGYRFLRIAFGMEAGAGLERRLGLVRASGPFPHPILFGLFCATVLSLAWFALFPGKRFGPGRLLMAAVAAAAAALSLSSGALLSVICQGVLIGWDRGMQWVRRPWWALLLGLVGVYVAMSVLASRSPINVLISRLTFNPQTGFMRKHIWNFGVDEVKRHPVFGIGFSEWSRPSWMVSSSIDNFYLVEAMRYGLPAVLLLGGGVLLLARGVARYRPAGPYRVGFAWMFSVAALGLAATSVHLWDSAFTFTFLLLGSGAWMANQACDEALADAEQSSEQAR